MFGDQIQFKLLGISWRMLNKKEIGVDDSASIVLKNVLLTFLYKKGTKLRLVSLALELK